MSCLLPLARAPFNKNLIALRACSRLGAACSIAIGKFVGSRGIGVGELLQLHDAGLGMGALLLGQTGRVQFAQNRASAPRSGALTTPRPLLRCDVGAGKRDATHYEPNKEIIQTHGDHPFAVRKNT